MLAQTGRGALEGGPLQASGISLLGHCVLHASSLHLPRFSILLFSSGCSAWVPAPSATEAGAGVGLTSLAICLPGHFLPSPGVWCFANCQFVYCLCFDYWRWEGRSSFCCPILYGSGVSVLFLNSWFCVGSQVSVTRETHSSLAK